MPDRFEVAVGVEDAHLEGVSANRTRPITLYRQGGVHFLVNEDPDSFAADFAKAHGPSACGFATPDSRTRFSFSSRASASPRIFACHRE